MSERIRKDVEFDDTKNHWDFILIEFSSHSSRVHSLFKGTQSIIERASRSSVRQPQTLNRKPHSICPTPTHWKDSNTPTLEK